MINIASNYEGVIAMYDLQFDSSLTIGQIEKNFVDVDLFSGIMDGLKEALSFEKGQKEMRKAAQGCFDKI